MAEQSWGTGATDEQLKVITASLGHTRLLAGPGTGKTWTIKDRILYLIEEASIPPNNIMAITFTRAAAGELRKRLSGALEKSMMPDVRTLHSFALRQLLKIPGHSVGLPMPIRIADDWEQRNIVEEDLKELTSSDIWTVRDKLAQLSADWETLSADGEHWEQNYPDPKFLGAWKEHRSIFGYTLRSELVYRLKRAFSELGDVRIDPPIKQLVVDEFQDLNPCDLAVVHAIVEQGAHAFAAGDDDQSIYGFRFAYPAGIRNFPSQYQPSQKFPLTLCRRCPSEVIKVASYVAALDPRRLPKDLIPIEGKPPGEIAVLRFQTGLSEAQGIARLCRSLLDTKRVAREDEILILLRSDRNKAYSRKLREALKGHDVQVAESTQDKPSEDSRQVMAILRLAVNPSDHLAWRTLVALRRNNIGRVARQTLYEEARQRGTGYAGALANSSSKSVKEEMAFLAQLTPSATGVGPLSHTQLRDLALDIAQKLGLSDPPVVTDEVLTEFGDPLEALDLDDWLRWRVAAGEENEPQIKPGAVNILTMHKAKGLEASVVFVAACEDELLPGLNQAGDRLDDERRLLYVSLTRSKERLFITYSLSRSGQQQHTGRTPGQSKRNLTTFLRDGPFSPVPGETYQLSAQ
ncbi:MAG TPA: ATP-dependent helicase [Dehalococcoidia bacterium]|nr:ATP-dependent helicase [Dehalococcoidia bacterium]